MGAQTTLTSLIYFPDGAKVSVKEDGAGSYTDIGALDGDVTAVLEYDKKSRFETANAGPAGNSRLVNMSIAGAFNLIHWDPANIVRLGNGIYSSTAVAGSPNSLIPDQVIAAGWSLAARHPLTPEQSSSDSTKLKFASTPVLTSVTLDAGAPEVLDEGVDYVVVEDPNTLSGYSMVFTDSITEGSPETYSVTIVYGTNTPTATTVLTVGTASLTMAPYAIKIENTDGRILEIFSAEGESGAFQHGFKSSQDDGVEVITYAFKGLIDTDLTDGAQLFSMTFPA